jgi:hypothetical protein
MSGESKRLVESIAYNWFDKTLLPLWMVRKPMNCSATAFHRFEAHWTLGIRIASGRLDVRLACKSESPKKFN